MEKTAIKVTYSEWQNRKLQVFFGISFNLFLLGHPLVMCCMYSMDVFIFIMELH